jgi:uncharacterized membrane protein (UPF0127 family)
MILAAAIAALLGGGLFVGGCRTQSAPAVTIDGTTWTVELATTPGVRQQGLSGRKSIPAGTGMLFVFPAQEPVEFYMKDCAVPIDIAFINSEMLVVAVRQMTVEPDPSDPKTFYPSDHPAQYALEVAGGELAKAGVKKGDSVQLLGPAADAVKAAR